MLISLSKHFLNIYFNNSYSRYEYLPEMEPKPGHFRSPGTWLDSSSARVPQNHIRAHSKDDSDVSAACVRRSEEEQQERAAVTEVKELRFYAEQVEAENRMLRELVENQKNDIDCLLKLSDKVIIHRRRINTEEKEIGRRCCLGDRNYSLPSCAIAILH